MVRPAKLETPHPATLPCTLKQYGPVVLKLPELVPEVTVFGQLPPPDVLEDELLLDDELELLEDEELPVPLEDELLLDEELLELELLEEELLEEPPDEPLTIPYGAGWPEQVLRETQLWLFSQPQPLAVFWHNGIGEPYQLQ